MLEAELALDAVIKALGAVVKTKYEEAALPATAEGLEAVAEANDGLKTNVLLKL